MQTKQKPQAAHICTQRLIEIRTDTKTETYANRNVKIKHLYKVYIKQIQYK